MCGKSQLPVTGTIFVADDQAPNRQRFVQYAALIVLLLLTLVSQSFAVPQDQGSNGPLKQLSLAELGNVEVTTASKEPEEVWKSCSTS